MPKNYGAKSQATCKFKIFNIILWAKKRENL